MLETLYTAYYTIGLLAYIIALVSYLPFIVSLVRMACRDTETRRLIFYRNCFRLWVFVLCIDLWTVACIEASIDELCEVTGFMPNEIEIASHFGYASIENETLVSLCQVRVLIHRFNNLYHWHLIYVCLLYVARRNWLKKRENRIMEELRFTERIISKEGLTA